MSKRSMRGALAASVQDEATAFRERTAKDAGNALQDRFAKAEAATGESVPAPAEAPAAPKVVRDTFTFPQGDYDRIEATRERALGFRMAVTKSEVLRAGLVALGQLTDAQLSEVLGGLEKVATGRPAKNKNG